MAGKSEIRIEELKKAIKELEQMVECTDNIQAKVSAFEIQMKLMVLMWRMEDGYTTGLDLHL